MEMAAEIASSAASDLKEEDASLVLGYVKW